MVMSLAFTDFKILLFGDFRVVTFAVPVFDNR